MQHSLPASLSGYIINTARTSRSIYLNNDKLCDDAARVKAFSWQPGPIPLINNDTSIWAWIKKEAFSLPCKKKQKKKHNKCLPWRFCLSSILGGKQKALWVCVSECFVHVCACIYIYMCVCVCVCVWACTLLGKWACQYAVQASLWWQADDSAVIGLISPRTWGEIWRLPPGSGAYHLPTHTHTLACRFGCVHTHKYMLHCKLFAVRLERTQM